MGSTAHPGTKTVLIFYSSKTEPQLPELYSDSLTYLRETDVEANVVDVEEDRDLARSYDVIATPTVVVEQDGEAHKHVGIVNGLKPVLEEDMYGQSLLHEMGFKRGRRMAREHDLSGETDAAVIEQALDRFLGSNGMNAVELVSFAPEQAQAECVVQPDLAQDTSEWHDKLEEFLGGVFTEVFDAGVMGVETACSQENSDCCRFAVRAEQT